MRRNRRRSRLRRWACRLPLVVQRARALRTTPKELNCGATPPPSASTGSMAEVTGKVVQVARAAQRGGRLPALRRRATLPCQSFEDLFAAVESGEVAYGMLPMENREPGSINASTTLMDFDLGCTARRY